MTNDHRLISHRLELSRITSTRTLLRKASASKCLCTVLTPPHRLELTGITSRLCLCHWRRRKEEAGRPEANPEPVPHRQGPTGRQSKSAQGEAGSSTQLSEAAARRCPEGRACPDPSGLNGPPELSNLSRRRFTEDGSETRLRRAQLLNFSTAQLSTAQLSTAQLSTAQLSSRNFYLPKDDLRCLNVAF